MAVIGYMGESSSRGIVFSVSDQTVLTLENFKWSGSARYSIHNRHNYHALTEYTGTIGSKCYGKYRWNIVSHEMTAKYTDRHGNIAGAVVSVTLQEYLRS